MKTSILNRICARITDGDRLFYLVLLLLLFLLAAILKLRYFSILFPVIFANIGIVLFLFFRERGRLLPECETNHVELEKNNIFQIDRSIPVISIIFFFIFFSLSLLSLLGENYTKSIPYYLCISICAAILIFEIFSVKSVICRYGILFQALLLSLNIVFANILIFIYGVSQLDFGFHLRFLREILITGHTTTFNEYGFYNFFTFHHIFAADGALLTGYDPQSIYILFGSFIVAIGVLFVFIIGKRFINFQFGLVAAVVFTCLDFYLMWGEHPEHIAYCFGFALVCFTIILYTYRTQKSAFYLLFAFSAIAMILTHHLTSVIVFITICSLVLIDIFHFVQTRESSFPSKYIAATFVVLILAAIYIVTEGNLVQFVLSYSELYFMKITALITNFFPSPPPIVSIPITPSPVTSIPVTSIPVTPIPVTSIPVTPVPVTPSPVTPIPYAQLVSLPVSPSTVFDRLPLMTLLINTLGSSLLGFISILGFCSLIKKRSWFGDYTLINSLIFTFFLGFGILFPGVVFLPDRMYSSFQIFCLVFLGAFGIIWLRNSIPTSNRLAIVTCICILVAVMSFFSLASIINGFETSPLVDANIAYPKLYTTSQDLSFEEWRSSFIHDENQNFLSLPINDKGSIDLDILPGKSYLIFDRTLLKTGIFKGGTLFGQHVFISIDNGQLQKLNAISSYYDNGLINLMAKNPPS